MKLAKVRIENLRAIKDQTIEFGGYNCLVGPNGSGKSTVLCALNIFFRVTRDTQTDLVSLQQEDFYRRVIAEPIRITVTLTDLSPEAQKELKAYYRQGQLVISAEARWDEAKNCAVVHQYGQRLGMTAFAPFFKAHEADARKDELMKIYNALRSRYSELPERGTKDQMRENLSEFEASHPDEWNLIPSQDQFYGWTKGQNRLRKFIQYVFVPAVKDASGEQSEGKNSALAELLERTVRTRINFKDKIESLKTQIAAEYATILEQNQCVLADLSKSLCNRLRMWAHPDAQIEVKWRSEPEQAVKIDEPFAEVLAGEGIFVGQVARLGHGFQRSYLLALLHELSTIEPQDEATLVLGCEEPELYQHPPQLRHLREVFTDLSMKGTQVVLCTHCPTFVTGRSFEDIRLIRKCPVEMQPTVARVSAGDIENHVLKARGETAAGSTTGRMAKIHQALQPSINEIFFCTTPVLVEGLEDLAYITSYLHLNNEWESFRRLGGHIIPTDRKSHMIRPYAAAKLMDIPAYLVFDSDADRPDRNGSQKMHRLDNLTLLRLCGIANPEPLPSDPTAHFWSDGLVMWASNLGAVVENEIGTKNWQAAKAKISIEFGHLKNLEKNTIFISEVLNEAWQQGHKSDSLLRLCTDIINFASRHAQQ